MRKKIKKIFALCVLGMFLMTILVTSGSANDPNDWTIGGNGVGANSNLGTTTNYDLNIITNSATRMTVKGAGRIGIGTTNPLTTLHVVTSGADNHIRVQRAGYSPYMDICSGGAYAVLDCRNTITEVFGIWEDGTPRLHIRKGGNIGIGTTSPGDRLDVNGDIRVRGADIKDTGGTARITLTDNGRLDLKEDGGATSLSVATDGNVGIGTTSPVTTLDVNGGLALNIVTKTYSDSPYTATSSDYTILVDATSGAVTINLPPAANAQGQIIVVKKIDSSGNSVTIDANSSETIDGLLTQTISSQWGIYRMQCDGSNWYILF